MPVDGSAVVLSARLAKSVNVSDRFELERSIYKPTTESARTHSVVMIM